MKKVAFYLLLLLIPAWFARQAVKINWTEEGVKKIIRTDGKGYYAYLPAIFIYDDLHFTFWEETELKYTGELNEFNDYRKSIGTGVTNKYYAGTALMQAPFFALAHKITLNERGVADGYSKWYQIFVNVAALFYLTVGLIFFALFLQAQGFNSWKILGTIYALAFGTNIFVYSVLEPSMSHVYSFALVSIFVFLADRFFRQARRRVFILAAVVYALIVLVRPVNGILIFSLPFLAGSAERLETGYQYFVKHWGQLLQGALVFFAIVSLQPIIYKLQTGNFFVWSYQDEGFDFLDPSFTKILFSYKKGLFVYTPLALISLFGVLKMPRFRAWSLICFLVFVVYILSSWYPWWYGGSFSGRVFVEYFPFFFFSFAVLCEHLKFKGAYFPFMLLVSALSLYCMAQINLYRWGFIHWEGMTEQLYWETSERALRNIQRNLGALWRRIF